MERCFNTNRIWTRVGPKQKIEYPYRLTILALDRHTLLDIYAAFLAMPPQFAEGCCGFVVAKGSLNIRADPMAASLKNFTFVDRKLQDACIPKRLLQNLLPRRVYCDTI